MEQAPEGFEISNQVIQPKPKPRVGNKVLRSIGAGILGLAISKSALGAVPNPHPTEGYPTGAFPTDTLSSSEQMDPAEYVRQFVEAKEVEEVTFEEAKILVPHLANFFSVNINGRYSPEEMMKRTFIVRGDSPKEDDTFPFSRGDENGTKNFESALFKRLLVDYPDIVPNEIINNSTVRILSDTLFDDKVIGVTIHDVIFVFLDRVNGNMPNNQYKAVQYKSFEDIDCEKATPANNLVHVVLHEWGHLDHDYTNGSKQSDELAVNEDILLGNNNPSNSLKQESEVNGFQVYIDNKGWKNDVMANGLDENSVEIAVAKMAIENDLAFTTTGWYNSPRAMSNFNVILEQSGISPEELLAFHRSSDLKGFIFKVLDSISEKSFVSEQEKFRFGLKLFAPFIEGKEGWEIPFKKYFPRINIKDYPDNPYFRGSRSFEGCGVPYIKIKPHTSD